MSLTIDQILTPQTKDQYRTKGVAVLVALGIPADKWAPGGIASSLLTYSAQVLSMLSTTLSNAIQSFFLPTATALAIASGDSGLLILLATYGYGVAVPQATFANGNVTLTNAGGGVYTVAAGNLTVLNPATNQTYTNKTGFTLNALSALSVAVQCTQPGSVGSANPGAITTLVTPLLGVTCANVLSLVGIDQPTPTAIAALCLASLGARSVRGPRSAYAYNILTAVNSITGAPVNINRYTITTSSHTGAVSIYIASPTGTVLASDLTGVVAAIEGLQSAPFGGARPDAVTVTVSAAAPIAYAPTITPYVLAPVGVQASTIATAIGNALTGYMSAQITNPIGGVAASDDANASLKGIFASGIYGAVAQGVASVVGCALISCKGATDLALAANQVATNGIVVNSPVITLASS